jgi:hypothetical protein
MLVQAMTLFRTGRDASEYSARYLERRSARLAFYSVTLMEIRTSSPMTTNSGSRRLIPLGTPTL